MIPRPDWSRRYVTRSRRLCARPGCGAVAAATLRFEPTLREAWLVAIDSDGPRTHGDLCSRHANALVLPRGWALHDDWRAPADASAHTPIDPQSPAFEEPPAPMALAPPPSTEPQPTISRIDALLDAQTPMLRRAFRNARPR